MGRELRNGRNWDAAPTVSTSWLQAQGQQIAQTPSASIFTREGWPANVKAFEQSPLYSAGGPH